MALEEYELEEAREEVLTKIKGDREKQLERDLRAVIGTDAGRRFIWTLLGDCGVFRTSFTGNNSTFFNEGKRFVGLEVLKRMNSAAPEAFANMQREAADRYLAEQQRLNKESKDVRTS